MSHTAFWNLKWLTRWTWSTKYYPWSKAFKAKSLIAQTSASCFLFLIRDLLSFSSRTQSLHSINTLARCCFLSKCFFLGIWYILVSNTRKSRYPFLVKYKLFLYWKKHIEYLSIRKSHIVCLNSQDTTYIFVWQLHFMPISFKLKSIMVSKPITHLSTCLF